MKIGHWHSGFRCRVSGVRRETAIAGLKPETRNLKPMLREGYITPDNVQKKSYFHSKSRNLPVGEGIDNLQQRLSVI